MVFSLSLDYCVNPFYFDIKKSLHIFLFLIISPHYLSYLAIFSFLD